MPYAKSTILRCAVCAKDFHKRQADQVCCSHACGHIYKRKPKVVVVCAACGSQFERATSQQTYCSVPCAASRKRKDRTVICGSCGVVFERPHGKSRAFCSCRCAMKSRAAATGQAHPEGTTYRDGTGYVRQKVAGKWVMQHRLVVEQALGRPLQKSERVHHKNCVRDDNRPENLELWMVKGKKDPAGVRVADAVRDLLRSLPPDELAKVLAEFKL